MEKEGYQSFIDDLLDIYNNKATRLTRYEEAEDEYNHPSLFPVGAALKLLEKYTCGLLEFLPKGMIIAGSSILKCLYKPSDPSKQWEPFDIDFYIQEGGEQDVKAIIEEIDSLFRILGETIIYKNSPYVITYVVRLKHHDSHAKHFIAQLIIAPTTMNLLLASFHGNLVGAAYDTTTKSFYLTERFKRFIETGESRFTNVIAATSKSSVNRAFLKYQQRGFKLIESYDHRMTVGAGGGNTTKKEKNYPKSAVNLEGLVKEEGPFMNDLKADIITLQNQNPLTVKFYEKFSDLLLDDENMKNNSIKPFMEVFKDYYHIKICCICNNMMMDTTIIKDQNFSCSACRTKKEELSTRDD
jgi:hypothetical protein